MPLLLFCLRRITIGWEAQSISLINNRFDSTRNQTLNLCMKGPRSTDSAILPSTDPKKKIEKYIDEQQLVSLCTYWTEKK